MKVTSMVFIFSFFCLFVLTDYGRVVVRTVRRTCIILSCEIWKLTRDKTSLLPWEKIRWTGAKALLAEVKDSIPEQKKSSNKLKCSYLFFCSSTMKLSKASSITEHDFFLSQTFVCEACCFKFCILWHLGEIKSFGSAKIFQGRSGYAKQRYFFWP